MRRRSLGRRVRPQNGKAHTESPHFFPNCTMSAIHKHAVVLLYITGSVFFLAGSILSLVRDLRAGR